MANELLAQAASGQTLYLLLHNAAGQAALYLDPGACHLRRPQADTETVEEPSP